ncbi:mannose-1-phosphate guanylyltransferase/mannose-6-phosphate isomerase [Raoultella planticola]|uniref:mannose-1-phosphate guanylyltransferase/mannose-6-phosphate isomerase n=1 Tax=Raoultella ornithinolytica TaxID=54291 RepID=UPI0002F888B6|nr:mannose-1-phosphate guanylyltransferase/mannose-6-phosphate isomerase [Raoultella ornithinolytica]EKU2862121.1 mannose-1-phosphate guanylyltransferase/mannose-6-phosphate isomerase [Raoultella ornithinolytica]HDT6582312.1 mannose-1-phosphate guanylyltransferase/mannose-6-phosphate isomerase [Raoultella ornithinolytica]
MFTPVIMAGGTGSRLWPMSRELYPKQFLQLKGNNTMLQETVLRLNGLEFDSPLVICNEQHRFLVAEQLRKINHLSQNIILEPVGRNTAPAIALAAFSAIVRGEDPILLVLAADHVIENKTAFHEAIKQALPLAEQGELVTFGIVPQSPETGYGYIQRGECLSADDKVGYRVDRFVEKPDLSTAQKYLNSGQYYWNSGMFMFKASKYLNELSSFRPDIYIACESSMQHSFLDNGQDFIRVNSDTFNLCPEESVDYAVMEKTQSAVVVPLDASWNDVGSWSALWDVNIKNEQNNVLIGDIFTHDTHDCYINTDEKFIASVGVKDLVIVSTKDAVLVIDKNKVQDVKKVVEYLKNNDRHEHRVHRQSYKPWGYSDKVVSEKSYKVNRVVVKPGGQFSLQQHHHRSEHWVILSGTAKVTLEERTFLLTENQSTFIPIGATHMLENPGKIPLEVLEIQSGSYLNEDDIVRLKDHYGTF